MPTPSIQRRWKNLPGEPVGDAGDPYTGYDRFGRTEQMRWIKPHTVGSGFDTMVNVQWGYNRASQKTCWFASRGLPPKHKSWLHTRTRW